MTDPEMTRAQQLFARRIPSKDWHRPDECARYLGLHERSVLRLTESGELHCLEHGGGRKHRRISRESILIYMARHYTGSSEDAMHAVSEILGGCSPDQLREVIVRCHQLLGSEEGAS